MNRIKELVYFLQARWGEEEASARRVIEASWPEEIWVTTEQTSSYLAPSVAIREDGPKRFFRVWWQDAKLTIDHGWLVYETAECVWSRALAERRLRDIEAKRLILKELPLNDLHAPYDALAELIVERLAAVYRDHPSYPEDRDAHTGQDC